MPKTITLTYPRYNKKAKQAEVTYPGDATTHWDANQRTLQIKAPDGQPLAVFVSPTQVLVGDQVQVTWSTVEDES